MKTSLKTIQLAAKEQMTYRLAMFSGWMTNLFWGIFRYYLFLAIYGSRTNINGLTDAAATTYVPLTQSLLAFLKVFGNFQSSQMIYSGQGGMQLLKPQGFFRCWLSYYFGKSMVNFVLRGIVLFVVFAAFFPVTVPHTFTQWLLFSVSLIVSWFVSHVWIITVNLVAIWSKDATGILRMVYAMQQLLAGMLFPIRLFPVWFQQVCYLTPFPAMLNVPMEIFTGTLGTQESIAMILQQLLWCGALVLLGQLVLRSGVRRLTLEGG